MVIHESDQYPVSLYINIVSSTKMMRIKQTDQLEDIYCLYKPLSYGYNWTKNKILGLVNKILIIGIPG